VVGQQLQLAGPKQLQGLFWAILLHLLISANRRSFLWEPLKFTWNLFAYLHSLPKEKVS